jgi:hypothetical protein
MMLTMHSMLASRYSILSKTLELLMLLISTILVAITFIDPIVINYFNIKTEIAHIVIGASAILVFFFQSFLSLSTGREKPHNIERLSIHSFL